LLIKEFGVNNYIGFLRKIDGLNFSYFSLHIGIDKFIVENDKLNSIWLKNALIDYSINPISSYEQQKLKLDFLKNGAIKIWSNKKT
jgi:hypothetical protein